MSGNKKKMQDTETSEWVNWIEEKTIIAKTDIAENTQFSSEQGLYEETLTTNSSELQGKLSQIFDKINIEEIDPITVLKERDKLLFEKGFDIIVDEVNDLIFKLSNKGIEWKLIDEQVIEYFNEYNTNSREIYNWLLNNLNNSNSIFLLGYFNYFGKEISKNHEKAFNLFIDASEKNHILAQTFAGECYQCGNGTIKNEKLAFEYIEKVANKNFANGQLRIGYFYDTGVGIKQDINNAFYWYEKAANNGNIMAIYNLGYCYNNGKGVTKDINKAIYLYEKSAKQGHHKAQYGLEMLLQNNQ
jgi:TPR repeat protein